MAYIDSELAKRHQGHVNPSTNASSGILSPTGALIDAGLNRQPAALGRLHEIDLGPDSTLRNITRTEAAKRRLAGGADVEEEKGPVKVRLRRDGKPWRGRKRRNSNDVKRDQLVEEVMRETRRKPYPSNTKNPTYFFFTHSTYPQTLQWKSTMNPSPTLVITMRTKPRTTVSPSNSAATSLMPFPHADNDKAEPPRLPKRPRRASNLMSGPRARSLGGAGVRGRRCGRCRRRRRRRSKRPLGERGVFFFKTSCEVKYMQCV